MTYRLIEGDCRRVLSSLDENSVQCCLTSPPYLGLRDYGVDGQIGHEASLAAYVGELVDVMRTVRPALKPTGTLWLNLGDSYVGSGRGPGAHGVYSKQKRNPGSMIKPPAFEKHVPDKNLMGVPWAVAFALQADGWILRRDVIWWKTNAMPGSAEDRPSSAHEYLFLFSLRERYQYDSYAVREPYAESTLRQFAAGTYNGKPKKDYAAAGVQTPGDVKRRIIERGIARAHERGGVAGANLGSVWPIATARSTENHFAVMPEELARRCVLLSTTAGDTVLDPFAGTGTTGVVALRERCEFVGIELNPKDIVTAKRRLAETVPLFVDENVVSTGICDTDVSKLGLEATS